MKQWNIGHIFKCYGVPGGSFVNEWCFRHTGRLSRQLMKAALGVPGAPDDFTPYNEKKVAFGSS